LALKQVSAFRGAQINERIAAEDVAQAKSAFYPKVGAAPNFIYTTPSLSKITTAGVAAGNLTAVTERPPSFIGANAITEYQGLVTVTGEIDTSGRLQATLKRNQALNESAHAGTEIARRDLTVAVSDAYYNLALASARRRGAEMNLQAAETFENNTKMQLDAGEVAPVDFVRARLQTASRRDELEQARANESVGGDALRLLIGYDFTQAIATEDLLMQIPQAGEIDNYTQTAVSTRPEFAQFEADMRAAEQEARIARSERRPQVTYSLNGGFVSDSLNTSNLRDHLGASAQIGVTLPFFDSGASRSRETQARLRIQQTQNSRVLAERQFAQAFFSARTQALSAASRIKQIATAITDAEMNVSASLARYQAGEASIVEVTDAQNTLIAQRQAFYQAIFDYQTARARLLRAIGQ
jgi:outer membrane protein